MAFSFGFAGDDIDISEPVANDEERIPVSVEGSGPPLKLVEAKRHAIDEWLLALPSQISFNRLQVGPSVGSRGREITLARREVFDVRTQLMAEDDFGWGRNESLAAGLEGDDLQPAVYEGGFKTWECAFDLAKLVATENFLGPLEMADDSECRHIIELGAGTALPSLTLFAQLLREVQSGRSRGRTHFTFADYNSSVLRLVTLPNLILTWNDAVSCQGMARGEASDGVEQSGELDITLELLENFKEDLNKHSITVNFISGAWSHSFVDLTLSAVGRGISKTVILASETIYSPSSLASFSETMLTLLRRTTTARARSRAFVAAKKIYFGVGGGVDEFLAVLRDISAECDVKERVNINSEGVGRVILEVTDTVSS